MKDLRRPEVFPVISPREDTILIVKTSLPLGPVDSIIVTLLDFHMTDHSLSPRPGGLKLTPDARVHACPKC